MSLGAELRIYLITLRCLGLLSITHDSHSRCTGIQDSWISISTRVSNRDKVIALVGFITAQCAAFSALVYLAAVPESFKLPEYNSVGNIYLVCDCGLACLLVALLYLLFYTKRRSYLSLLTLLIYHNRVDLENRYAQRFLRLYCVHVLLTALCCLTHAKAYTHSNIGQLPTLLLSVAATYSYMLAGLIIVFYNCLTHILVGLLRNYNRDLAATTSLTLFVWRLRQRNRLLWICHEQLNAGFGPVMLLIVAYALFIAPAAPFFLITMVFKMDAKHVGLGNVSHSLVTCLLWNFPWVISLLLILRTDAVRKEANKTAKILAKIPRTGSGLDKMIEKFLLKNLRQQPILTAYGFFALDKSTLFKLFAAIFTYMVILVQFKEMENTARPMQTTQSS